MDCVKSNNKDKSDLQPSRCTFLDSFGEVSRLGCWGWKPNEEMLPHILAQLPVKLNVYFFRLVFLKWLEAVQVQLGCLATLFFHLWSLLKIFFFFLLPYWHRFYILFSCCFWLQRKEGLFFFISIMVSKKNLFWPIGQLISLSLSLSARSLTLTGSSTDHCTTTRWVFTSLWPIVVLQTSTCRN